MTMDMDEDVKAYSRMLRFFMVWSIFEYSVLTIHTLYLLYAYGFAI